MLAWNSVARRQDKEQQSTQSRPLSGGPFQKNLEETRFRRNLVKALEVGFLINLFFLVAYVISENLWYVVPADAFVPRVTVHFNYGPKSQGMFEIYRETWCLLACPVRARGRGDIPRRCRCEELPVRCVVCPRK